MPLTDHIGDADPACGFRCGVPALDEYFARHALPNDRRGLGRTFVLRAAAGGTSEPAVLGFFTLSMTALAHSEIPARLARGLPRYPIPMALIGRLAVDERARGRGTGGQLVSDALARILGVSETVGCFGVIVDAKDEAAAAFHGKHGFAPIGGGWPRRMLLPMKSLRSVALDE